MSGRLKSMQFVNGDINDVPGKNTFRVGDKYALLKAGDVVDALGPDNHFVRKLKVKAVHVLSLTEALAQHASKNYETFGLPDDEAADKLLAILTPIYKLKGRADAHTVTCVVEFEPDAVSAAAE